MPAGLQTAEFKVMVTVGPDTVVDDVLHLHST